MKYIDPDGPIEVLRNELIELVTDLMQKLSPDDRAFLRDDVIPLLKTDEGYARCQARRLVKSAREYGLKVNVTRH